MTRIEHTILNNLVYEEEFCRKTAPFIDSNYFGDRFEKIICQEILAFFSKYNKVCTKDILKIEVNNRRDVNDKELVDIIKLIDSFTKNEVNQDWLLQKTEKFCKDRAVYNAILNSIKIIEGKDDKQNQEAIPKILQDALAVSFDSHVGHDYLLDTDDRYEFYHRIEEKVAFDLDLFNKITCGGMSNKSLSVVLCQTGGGKSAFMCHVAAATLMQGKNVLYLTMEMAEQRIAERIDANLMELSINELKVVDKSIFNTKINRVKQKTQGRLIIKEYPTGAAHSGHFRALIEELKMKKDFIPNFIVIDYLNICASSRLKMGATVNSYSYIKSIAEELRGLAVEYNVPILSATQSTRSAQGASNISISDTSESIGLPATVDLLFGLVRTEELDQLNQVLIVQLKNRYAELSRYKKFIIGVDWPMMKFYDVEQSAQEGIDDSGQDDISVFDRGKFGKRLEEERFDGFKF